MTVSRRTVLSAAWAAPVVTLAIAAPLAAATGASPTLTATAALADGWVEVIVTAKRANGVGAASTPVTFQRGDDDGFGGIEWVDMPDYSNTLNEDGEMSLLWPVEIYPAGRFRALVTIDGVSVITVFPLPV